ncbi:M42 family metallopeptidase [Bacillus horti]|uniref:Endoglucanase n=1 Tax=Caldalkalibacillus horti TaxID=77523 RepID=A0ABT9W2M3_9BACI|nr:M42 family metallopeptidase [Bacillus horti]MDQ0167503.1 endoglucanase [Bacillus horti]
MKDLLQQLTSLIGPPGFEEEVARFVYKEAKKYADEVRIDALGNVIALKKGRGSAPSVLLSAHMDETGFVVKKIEPNGLIRFEKNGGHDDRIILAQKVKLRTETGYVKGVIGTISAHFMKYDDPQKVRKHAQLYIDVGASNAEEVHSMGIEVGTPIGWDSELDFIGQADGVSRLVGKSFDDRASCAILLELLKELKEQPSSGDVYAVFSVQEEVGLRGAQVAAYHVQPDVALAVDTTAVSDTFEEMMDGTLALGKGAGIKVLDFSLVAHPWVRKRLVEVAKKKEINYQMEVFPGIGTDGGALATSLGGIPTGVVSIPTRYAHSPVEVMDWKDFEACYQLVEQFVRSLEDGTEIRFVDVE